MLRIFFRGVTDQIKVMCMLIFKGLEIFSVEADKDMVSERLQGAQTLTWTYMSHLRSYT